MVRCLGGRAFSRYLWKATAGGRGRKRVEKDVFEPISILSLVARWARPTAPNTPRSFFSPGWRGPHSHQPPPATPAEPLVSRLSRAPYAGAWVPFPGPRFHSHPNLGTLGMSLTLSVNHSGRVRPYYREYT